MTPQKELDVQGSIILSDSLFFAGSQSRMYRDGANLNVRSGANLKLRSDGGGYDVIIYSDNTRIATFEGNTKNLGIGTSSPSEKLDVVGVAKAEQFR